jgi:hypothetical protein
VLQISRLEEEVRMISSVLQQEVDQQSDNLGRCGLRQSVLVEQTLQRYTEGLLSQAFGLQLKRGEPIELGLRSACEHGKSSFGGAQVERLAAVLFVFACHLNFGSTQLKLFTGRNRKRNRSHRW